MWGFSWIADKISSAIDYVADKVSSAIDYVKEKGSKLVSAITGKDTFEEAETLMKEIEDRYDKAKFEYEEEMKVILPQLESKINTINYHKKDIFENHFERFKKVANRLHNLNIEGKNFLEYFDDSITEIKVHSGVKNRTELYQIDFNNLGLKDVVFGVLTLGFFTRKKAKQTLNKVQEEEIRINEEIEKMKSQVNKLQVVLKSIDNVAEYFVVLIESYSKLLDRFSYGVSSQILKATLNNQKLDNGQLNFKLIPIVHIEEFQALFNLSIVLKQMATMGYLTQDGDIDNKDIDSMNNIKFKMEQIKVLAS